MALANHSFRKCSWHITAAVPRAALRDAAWTPVHLGRAPCQRHYTDLAGGRNASTLRRSSCVKGTHIENVSVLVVRCAMYYYAQLHLRSAMARCFSVTSTSSMCSSVARACQQYSGKLQNFTAWQPQIEKSGSAEELLTCGYRTCRLYWRGSRRRSSVFRRVL